MNAPRHLLVRASAGTGKTHRLTRRYLALLLEGADPSAILATTFTRKAAHEILDRVLGRLAEAAEPTRGVDALASLAETVGREVRAEECLDLLARLLRGPDRIRVSTIDAFFVQLAHVFALDLGLPAGWRIADEAERDLLRADAVSDAVAGADRMELLELLRDLQRQAIGQGAHAELLEFVQKGREALLESRAAAWDRIRPLPAPDPDALDVAIASLPRLPIPKTKAGKDRARWAGAREKLLACVGRGDWLGILDETLAQRCLEPEGVFDGCPIEAAHRAILRPILGQALHLRTTSLALENRAARALLERHEESYRLAGRERGLLGFDDLPAVLAPVAERGPVLAHRLDGRIDHLLLDEFQDTAPAQWRVLGPIADGDRTFFCVGDEKQSIYGWRAAEPRLLRDLSKKRPELVQEQMHRSFRSSRPVLDTVNQVFARIPENPAFVDGKGGERVEAIAAALEFQGSFAAHEPAVERPGAACLLRAREPGEDEGAHAPSLALAVERAVAIVAECPLATVGILMRRRKWIPELIRRLREAGIAASDEGGNPLTDSVAVLHALSLLHLADHPADLAAAFHVATSPLGPKVALAPEGFAEAASAVARKVRRALGERGFGGFLATIRPAEGDGYGAWDVGRFGQLVDLALAWESRAGSRPGAFVGHVRKTKVEDPSAAQVRVMTVHGAKGLEFDAVILPELDEPLARREDRLLTLRPDPEGEIEIVTHALPKAIAAAHPELERVRADVAQRRMVEELCVLYVAMTRAAHRLDLIVRAREEEGGGLTYAAILRGALGVEVAGTETLAWKHPESAELWYPPEIAAARKVPPVEKRPLRLAPSRGTRSLASLAPSRAKDLGAARAADLLLPRDAMTARGRLVHRMLQEVEWIETFDRSDEDLLAIARRMEVEEKVVRSALEEFRAALGRPRTKQLLSRPKGEVEVWRERAFSIVMPGPDGRDSLWTGAFDRVVLRSEGGRRVSADVVDFKTDRVEGAALDERAESYRPQMEAYRRALARIAGLKEGDVRAWLAFLTRDEVRIT